MFQSARLKLTGWYLCIIMLISIIFSMVLYNFLTHEFDRIEHFQRIRVERYYVAPPPIPEPDPHPVFDPTVFQDARTRVLLALIFINLIIFIGSGGAGYFLAGLTLGPIKEMVDEQNRFITDASHELRTPLTSLKSEIEVYLRSHNHTLTEAEAILTSNLEEVNSLQVLSDNLIQLAQFQKTNGNIPVSEVSVTDIIHTVEKKFSVLAKQKHITFQLHIVEQKIRGNRESFIEVLSILIDNAIKYSPEKSTISLSSEKTDHTMLLQVSDQGIGIEKKDLPHIFDRFYRADMSRTKKDVPGYGLGLSIAKKIVEMYQGYISVKSTPGNGTIFTIQLPTV